MRLLPTRSCGPGAKHGRRAFTLVEVLAALLFMAILLPVTVNAVRVASRAGQVSDRKATATRVAERVMNELLVTGGLAQNSASGRIDERDRVYEWRMLSQSWAEDRMNLVTVRISYEVQGQNYDVSIATLYDPTQIATAQNR
jgi:type II secretory pathway pseudopilin PulG